MEEEVKTEVTAVPLSEILLQVQPLICDLLTFSTEMWHWNHCFRGNQGGFLKKKNFFVTVKNQKSQGGICIQRQKNPTILPFTFLFLLPIWKCHLGVMLGQHEPHLPGYWIHPAEQFPSRHQNTPQSGIKTTRKKCPSVLSLRFLCGKQNPCWDFWKSWHFNPRRPGRRHLSLPPGWLVFIYLWLFRHWTH